MATKSERSTPYHHGDLERAVLDGAVEEVQTVGVAAVSLRRIARRASVTHAALAYHFGDKAGVFTVVATEGFTLAAEEIGPTATGPDGFIVGGESYIRFALGHPAHFEVMFRPYLYRADDPKLLTASRSAFDVLFTAARRSLESRDSRTVTDDEVRDVVLAGWSMAHGFASLALTSVLTDRMGDDLVTLGSRMPAGVTSLADLVRRMGNRPGYQT